MPAIDEIKKICVLGAGRMGTSIALRCGAHGYDVTIYEVSEQALARFPAKEMTDEVLQKGLLSRPEFEAALARISTTSKARQAAEAADLLIESVPEVLELKRQVHAQFDQLCPPRTVMTTNTSTLLVSEIEDVVQRGDRFAALHFTNWQSFVDIAGGPRTSGATIELLQAFGRSIGEVPITLKREKAGYLHNNLWVEMRQVAVSLLLHGHGDIEDIDRAEMIYHLARPELGPFAEMDRLGLDVVLQIARVEFDRSGDPDLKRVMEFLQPYVQRGELGRKTGKGFYTYPHPAYAQPGFLSVEK